MSNLVNAKKSIEAELVHARRGVAYYESRVRALERALEDIVRLADVASEQPAERKPNRKTNATKDANSSTRKATASKKQAPKKRVARVRDSGLPTTGSDFWKELVTTEPASGTAILNAGIAKLGITPTKDQVKKLHARMLVTLSGLIAANAIKDTGKGRDRRFFAA